ncbi:OmpA family protein [uncultured Lutibacter sp.]|uniref:OmpA family protein n=1 Tax=uncultured Lutibacter sp. TaxID=437739 RepID=UPI00261218C9|nr:OmpA family protein [uncultured Lutibacter sp.]
MLNYFKAFTIFSIWALIALTSHYYISSKIFNTCNSNSPETPTLQKNILFSIIDSNNAVLYNFSEGFTINNKNNNVSSILKIPYLTDSIQHILANDYSKELIITGKYLETEIDHNLDTDIGIQRAELVKKELIKHHINAHRIKISSKISSFSFNKEGIYTDGIEMKFNTLEKQIIDSLELTIINRRLYIEFKNDSLMSNQELIDYNLLLKQYLKKHTDKKVQITGHTDNLGYYDNNLIIGLARANEVKGYFINNGINANIFETLSKGESEPIAEKFTEKGRAINRRIEITIN